MLPHCTGGIQTFQQPTRTQTDTHTHTHAHCCHIEVFMKAWYWTGSFQRTALSGRCRHLGNYLASRLPAAGSTDRLVNSEHSAHESSRHHIGSTTSRSRTAGIMSRWSPSTRYSPNTKIKNTGVNKRSGQPCMDKSSSDEFVSLSAYSMMSPTEKLSRMSVYGLEASRPPKIQKQFQMKS